MTLNEVQKSKKEPASIMNVKAKKAVKVDATCFDRIFMRFLSFFEKFDLTKKQ